MSLRPLKDSLRVKLYVLTLRGLGGSDSLDENSRSASAKRNDKCFRLLERSRPSVTDLTFEGRRKLIGKFVFAEK